MRRTSEGQKERAAKAMTAPRIELRTLSAQRMLRIRDDQLHHAAALTSEAVFPILSQRLRYVGNFEMGSGAKGTGNEMSVLEYQRRGTEERRMRKRTFLFCVGQ
jgi:hypothetical protein